jgi:hypothetical protein
VAVTLVLAAARHAEAQRLDLTLFTGLVYPTYEERLALPAGSLSIPGVEVTSTTTPELRGKGGAVLGAALAFELGVLGLEGRLDSMDAGIDFTGARLDLRGTGFPFENFTASVIGSPGRFDADRLSVTLRATPASAGDRLGLNGGAGLRIGGRVALTAEARVFYFREYELRFGTVAGPALIDALLAEADAIVFDPVFVNAQVGISFRF